MSMVPISATMQCYLWERMSHPNIVDATLLEASTIRRGMSTYYRLQSLLTTQSVCAFLIFPTIRIR